MAQKQCSFQNKMLITDWCRSNSETKMGRRTSSGGSLYFICIFGSSARLYAICTDASIHRRQQEDESSSAGGWLRPRRVGRRLTRWWTSLLYGRTSREPQRICEEIKSRIWGLLQLLRLVFFISGYFNSQSEISRNNAAKTELQNYITGLTLNLEEVDFLK